MEGPTEKQKSVRKYPSAREFNKHMEKYNDISILFFPAF